MDLSAISEELRLYQISRAVPGWTKAEVEDTPARTLDYLIQIHGVFESMLGGGHG